MPTALAYQGTHLGIIRATKVQNKTNIQDRISLARRTANSLMNVGVHGTNGLNPKTSYMIYRVYVLPRCPTLEGIYRESLDTIKRASISKIGLGNWNSNFHERTNIAQLILDCQQLALTNILPQDELYQNTIDEKSRNLCYRLYLKRVACLND
ncbi:unnamed protein product [Mytilus coruscus]|uniref:Uncharacterized protein n=1 Tax=Mytilus coruscus TaxID=42192 RepID=A0A6J8CBF0_MYTCO|nr:unnamed protein product [Mytilus coruscus]